MRYKHYPVRPASLTADFVRAAYDALVARIPAAEASSTAGDWLALFADWNDLSAYITGEGGRISYALSKDMRNREAEDADRYFREEITPAADDGSAVLVDALLASRHQRAVANRYGEQLIRIAQTVVEPLAPVNSDLRVKASDLSNQYNKIIASASVEIDGETMTLEAVSSLSSSDDPVRRRQAFDAYYAWFLEHRDELARIFDELVQLRDQMGRNLGHENFIRLGYLGMSRTDYGPAEVEAFREGIRKYAVPLQQKLYRRQAEALGTETLHAWDSSYDPALTLPSGIALPVESQLDKAQRVFEALSPRLAAHFTRMREEGLIDLENRPGKQAGAYCNSFEDEGRVVILCNSIGDSDDVGTLMHEMGHAFQRWESDEIEAVDLRWPTKDVSEIFSMGMEYLSMRHMNEFFSPEDADKFRRSRWKRAITILCYLACADEFQHWIYANPEATPDERDAAWSRTWEIYKPGIDYTGVEHSRSVMWYRVGHFFWAPFYMIDYAIAETGAMQLALIDAQDHDRAMELYLTLCRMGGTRSVLEIFSSAGLRSPFDPDLMRDLMAHAARELGIEE